MTVYYSPEEHGLELIGDAEEEGLSYEFNIFAVWRDEDGALYYAEDSGCSCPSPFENFHGKEDLTLAANVHQVFSALDAWIESYDGTENVDCAVPAMALRERLASI